MFNFFNDAPKQATVFHFYPHWYAPDCVNASSITQRSDNWQSQWLKGCHLFRELYLGFLCFIGITNLLFLVDIFYVIGQIIIDIQVLTVNILWSVTIIDTKAMP